MSRCNILEENDQTLSQDNIDYTSKLTPRAKTAFYIYLNII